MHDDGRQVAGAGDRAGAGQRVVDGVHATGGQCLAVQGVAGRQGRAFGRELRRGVVQAREKFVGLEVETGERADHGAQLPHGRGGVDPLARDLPDDQRGTGAGQGDGVVPRARAVGGRGDVRGFQSGVRSGATGKQLALHRRGDGVLPGVAARVVDAQRCVVGQLQREVEIAVVVRLGLPGAVEADQAQHGAAQRQRGDEE